MALRTLVLTLACALVATVGFAAGEEEAPAAAMEQEMVLDPTTGEMVTAPEYGGTLTYATRSFSNPGTDPFFGGVIPHLVNVLEKLGGGNWGIDRDEWDHASGPTPLSIIIGKLAASWETPDDTTMIFHIRPGVRWHDKEPMNGRELTAHDIEFTFHRMLGLGVFSEAGPSTLGMANELLDLPVESIAATDASTVVMKLKQPSLSALLVTLTDFSAYIVPPEVIEQHGDMQDWRNVVGTGPFMLTDLVEESSFTNTRNPDYWGYDEKYPENRLPYLDEIRYLNIPEEATLQAALLSGKIDLRGPSGGHVGSIDTAVSMRGAEKLLDEAGYPRAADGTRFKTVLNYGLWSDLGYVETAAAYWAEIGVEVEIDVLDYGVYHERLFSRAYEGMASAIAGTIYPPATLASWYHSENQWNRPGSQWPEMDALVEAFQAATTVAEQQKYLSEADMYAMQNHWLIWGPKLPQWWALQPWVKGYSGEMTLGHTVENDLILSRLWIDSALKEAMQN